MATASQNGGFSKEEREAMNARSRELAAEKRAEKKRADGEQAVMEAIEEMAAEDKALAKRIHELVTSTAPDLWPKTWYGMPAYAQDGKVICFFQAAGKFGGRYATFGFNDTARLDDGRMWPTSFAIVELTDTEEGRNGNERESVRAHRMTGRFI
ncbi:MAG: iron chaperone [Spirochaetota bacterium]